jgi:hypothetical protein
LKFGVPNPVVGSHPLVAFQCAPGMKPACLDVSFMITILCIAIYTYSRGRGSRLCGISTAAPRLAGRDIREATFISILINEGIQESERRFACAKACIVQACDNTSHNRCSCRSASIRTKFPADYHRITMSYLVSIEIFGILRLTRG